MVKVLLEDLVTEKDKISLYCIPAARPDAAEIIQKLKNNDEPVELVSNSSPLVTGTWLRDQSFTKMIANIYYTRNIS